jgi:hypothetical protein
MDILRRRKIADAMLSRSSLFDKAVSVMWAMWPVILYKDERDRAELADNPRRCAAAGPCRPLAAPTGTEATVLFLESSIISLIRVGADAILLASEALDRSIKSRVVSFFRD